MCLRSIDTVRTVVGKRIGEHLEKESIVASVKSAYSSPTLGFLKEAPSSAHVFALFGFDQSILLVKQVFHILHKSTLSLFTFLSIN